MTIIGVASSTSTTSQPTPGFFLLAWGLFASAIGLGLVTNFRGFAEKFARMSQASSAGLQRIPPWKWMPIRQDNLVWRVKLSRVIAIPFAILGPIVTVVGAVQILHGHISMQRGPSLPLPVGLGFVAISAIILAQYWRRDGMFRLASQQSGWMRTSAIVANAGALGFGVFMSIGLMNLAIASWLVGGLTVVPMLMSRKSVYGSPQGPADRP